MGDPSGVGPEVALKALASSKVQGLAKILLIGDAFVIDKARRDMGLKLNVPFMDLGNVSPKSFSYGKFDASFGRASIEYIDAALELIKRREARALVTAPVNKSSIKASGLRNFEGHTEYLAQRAGTKDYAMMFVGGNLKVTLVTRHVALKRVPGIITAESIDRALALTRQYLINFFRVRNPKIGVCGLNPHAGEAGAFGDEEIKIIAPAIKKASMKFKGLAGPIPADILFHDALNGKYDAIIAMYHDQALPAFKMLYFKTGVNMTLGLPFIRTSPDHGTAFNIAGRGIADPASMIEAILLACRLARRTV